MTRLAQLLLLSLSLSLTSAAPSANGRTQFAPKVIPSVWKKAGSAPAAQSLTFDLIFAPANVAGLEQRMLEISNSGSLWITEEEVASFIVPSDDAKTAVEAALKGMGATGLTYSRSGDVLTSTATVEQAAKVRVSNLSQLFLLSS